MKSKLQVFVSSTYTDLKDDRQAAVEAILKAGHIPAGMELFAAGDKSQWDVIKQWISDSDVYMLILGGRYGSVEEESGLSYTELEYDFAVKAGKPLFAVVIKEEALEARTKEHGSHVFEKENPAKLKAFRDKVLRKMSSFFSDHKDIKLAVHESLHTMASNYKLKGWVRHEEMPDIVALSKQLNAIEKENQELRKQNALSANKNKPSKSKDADEFQELIEMMSRIMINDSTISSLAIAKNNDPEKPLLSLVIYFKEWLISGVSYSTLGFSNDFIDLLFNVICPKLERYGLMQKENGNGFRYKDQYTITGKGWKFFKYLESSLPSDHEQEEPTEPDAENDRFPAIIANLINPV